MGVTFDLDEPVFFAGAGTTTLVPRPFDVAINGRPYVVDFEFTPFRREAYRHKSIELVRTQADGGDAPGEHTINPAGLWRRTQESWHHGSGQVYADRDTSQWSSDISRYHTSKGVDPWTPWQLAVLNNTALGLASTGSGIRLAVTAANLWFIDGTTLGHVANPYLFPFTPTTQTLPAAASSIVSDGYNIWVACGSSGVYTANDGSTTATQLVSSAVGGTAVIGFALGRLLVGNTNKLYNVISASPAVLPAALMTVGTNASPGGANFNWVGFAEGLGFIYAAGTTGAQSQIYKITITPDGTVLSPGSVAATLPKGELIQTVYGYLGIILIGTSLGVRVAVADASGNLTLGALIVTPHPVNCFEGQGRFVWFGWTAYDTTSTGLGRIDLSTLGALTNAPDTPGSASDLMFPGQGAVTSVVSYTSGTFTGRVFAVAGVGIVAEQAAVPVDTATFTSGLITYDISDLKYGVFIDVLPAPNAATITASLSNDGGVFQSCGTFATPAGSLLEYPTPQTPSNTLEVGYTITGAVTSGVPLIHRSTLRAMIAGRSSTQFVIPLRLSPQEEVGGSVVAFVPSDELSFLDDLRVNRRITSFQEGNRTYPVTVDVLDWTPDRITDDGAEMAGVCVVTMTSIT